ncbi:MAG: maleate cis-trans isomerase family protein [Alphaproteobacteria bacterium]
MTNYDPIIPRARLGFIIPSSNRMVEPQLQHYCPEGVVPHFNRIGMTNRHKAPLDELMPRILLAAELLGDSKCDVTVLQCTGTSMSGGVEKEREVISAIEDLTGKPAASAASSLMDAFQALNAQRLVFVSETPQGGHDKKLAFLKEAGLDIIVDKAMGLAGTDVYCSTPPEFWFENVKAMRNDDADAYFISCANIRSIDVIEALEDELDRPVITSNQAALWSALRLAGLNDNISALGRLFKTG